MSRLSSVCAKRIDRRNIEAGFSEIAEQRLDRSERIETDRMRDLVRTSGIVRQHDRQALVGGWCLREPPPGRNAGSNGLHALVIRLMGQMRKLQIGIALARPT